MDSRLLNTTSLTAMFATAVLWLAFGFTGDVGLLLVGAGTYLVGFTAFLAFVVSKVDEYLSVSHFQTAVDGVH